MGSREDRCIAVLPLLYGCLHAENNNFFEKKNSKQWTPKPSKTFKQFHEFHFVPMHNDLFNIKLVIEIDIPKQTKAIPEN